MADRGDRVLAPAGRGLVVCADVGSTYTKAALVDLDAGALLATSSRPTTIATDVMEGLDGCRADLGVADGVTTLACSSAGGGLRLAVVGYERVVTAEAGHRVGLSAGARVEHVAAGALSADDVVGLVASRPDVVLLVGGTDGGNCEILLHNAGVLAARRLTVPVVVAGNVDVRDEVVDVLRTAGTPTYATANVLPEIGRLDPRPAREAIREVFIRHVIGGKGLSRRADFPSLVRAATPDAVLAGVELLADGAGDVEGVGDVLVVDVGGATTDVYSVVTPQGEDAALRKEVVEVLWRSRTVEGDLGMRWGAAGAVDAAVAERLVAPDEAADLRLAAAQRVADPAYLPDDGPGRAVDARLAELAVTVALRRHGRGGGAGGGGGAKDLRHVRLVVGSGGALRHGSPDVRRQVLAPATSDLAGGWPLPLGARCVVDDRYVLAAAGLLAAEHPVTAARLLAAHLVARD